MPDKHIVIQKFNSKQCDVARLASGHENEYWVVATAPNVDVARGLVRRLNSAPEPVAPAIEGAKLHAANQRKRYPLTKSQRATMAALNPVGERGLLTKSVPHKGTLPALEKRGLVFFTGSLSNPNAKLWRLSSLGEAVRHSYSVK